MTRTKSQKVHEHETLIQQAISGIAAGTWDNSTQAATALGISRHTVQRRVKGGKSRSQGKENQQLLSINEEKSLTRWISKLTSTGHPASHQFIKEMAEEIRQQRDANSDNNLPSQILRPIGNSWVPYFLKRHPDLQTRLSRSIEASRIKTITKAAVLDWFNEYQQMCNKEEIDIENTYNIDETGIDFIC